MTLRLLSQKVAQAVDEELMSSQGAFSIDQLMELAGLSVAQSIQKSFDVSRYQRVLVCVGPGNNGGDGLVAARHLSHFGYQPSIYYPKQPNNDIYQRLLHQCKNLIPITGFIEPDQLNDHLAHQTDLIVDAIFGFSFHGDVRDPYKTVISAIQNTTTPIVSVDIPSGWDVTTGPTDQSAFQPNVLVSLTAPKECASHFKGQHHFLGGRFVPPALAAKFNIDIPHYPGADQAVEI